jgi:hypothetical protein
MPQNSLRSSRTFNLVVGSLLARSRTRARQTVWYVPLDKKRCIAYGHLDVKNQPYVQCASLSFDVARLDPDTK